MKNYRRNNYIGKMKKGFKQKLSLLMIACLLFTGYRGLTISGRADSSHTEQNNEIEVSGTQVKVQLLGADLRRAATEAILKGEKVGKSNLCSYSKDQELATEFEEYFDGEKEIYNIPLNSIAENLEESLNAEEAGLQIYVERDAKDLDRLVRKESKESLLLYSKESAVAGLLPKKEEATTVSLTEEEKASDSNLERNTELTGSELITFVYENKSTERMTFQLSVDGNKYPKVTVASKTSLFKQFLGDAKKAQAEAKNAKATEAKAESTEAQTVEASKAEESSTEAKQEVAESKATAETKATEESKASEEARKDDSEVAIVSTAAVAESTEAKAEVKTEASEEATEAKVESTETEVKETAAKAETAQAEKATEAQKAVIEDSSLLKDITEHSEEILPELQSIRFTQYSLNELGRKSQNVEIEGFGNVQVFYDEAAFDGDVVLEAKRLFKPEEEAEGEKLSEEQVKVLKEHSIYDDAASLDIRFVDKKDSAVEVEPKSPVSVRISIDKKALPAEVSSDAISIHHLVENDETKAIEKVEVVVQPSNLKGTEVIDSEETSGTLKTEENKSDTITKEFVVDSFSLYQINWTDYAIEYCPPIRFHYVDKNFNEIGPTVRVDINKKSDVVVRKDDPYTHYYWGEDGKRHKYNNQGEQSYTVYEGPGKTTFFNKEGNTITGEAYKEFEGYKFFEAYPYKEGADNLDTIVNGHANDYFDINYKYGPGDGDFRRGLKRIDSVGFTTALQNEPTTWYVKKRGWPGFKNCGTYDFYLVYDIETGPVSEVKEKFETQNEKYITKNEDGKTYNLTLTGQVKGESKQKLDIVFLVDVTKSRNLPFDFKEAVNRFTKNDYAKGEIKSRKAEIESNILNLVDDLSKNPNVDAKYALVGFGGYKKQTGSKTNMDSSTMKVTNNAVDIVDTPYDDLTHVSSFTSSVDTFKANLKGLEENDTEGVNGANYTAAMMGLGYILDGRYQDNIQSSVIQNNDGPRKDAKVIVVMVTDGDPTYSYIKQDGEYDETVRTIGKDDKVGTFSYIKDFKTGYSYGNGIEFSRVALNQARGYLSEIGKYHSFYSIGVGNEENWKHLKELTEVHGFDQRKIWDEIIKDGKPKYKRAKSALLTGADSKVFDGSDPDKLAASFKELEKKLIPSDRPTHFSITDTLSENVDLVKNSTLEYGVYKMTDAVNGVKLNPKELENLGNVSLEPFINTGDNGKPKFGVRLKPDNFSLPAGYEIRVTAKIEPSKIAYDKFARNEANVNQGGKRTDLYSLYKHYLGPTSQNNPYSNEKDYKISEDEFGLWTNKKAEFNYKWKGKDNPKDYANPIIKVKGGELKIEKQITGLKGKAYIKSVGFTKLGISVLKDITFTVYEVNENQPDKVYLTFKPYQDGDSGEQSNEGVFTEEKTKTVIKRSQAKYNSDEDILTLTYTITGLNPNKKYRVVEDVIPNTYNSDSSTSDGKRYRLEGRIVDTSSYSTTSGQTIVIKNSYTEVSKRKITVTKVVENKFTGDFITGDDANDVFDFYLRVYHPVRKWDKHGGAAEGEPVAFNKNELEQIRNSNPGKFLAGYEEVPPNSGTYALHFQLKHGQKIEFELDDNLAYDVSEKKTSDYENVKIMKSKTGLDKNWITCGFGNPDKGFWFICELLQVNEYQYVKIVNTSKRLIVPTGVTREITPYLFGIFGFVAMAGAYLTISKKRREA